jgi:hypothetical protein
VTPERSASQFRLPAGGRMNRESLARLIAEAEGEQEWLLKQKQHHMEVRERLKWIRRFLRLAQQHEDDLLSLALFEHEVKSANSQSRPPEPK